MSLLKFFQVTKSDSSFVINICLLIPQQKGPENKEVKRAVSWLGPAGQLTIHYVTLYHVMHLLSQYVMSPTLKFANMF